MIFGLLLAFCSAVAFAQAIDINTATAAQLEGLKGIGPKKAAEIVKYREANGPFKSVEDLSKVSGVGAKTLTANKDMLMVGGAAMPSTPKMPDVPKAASAVDAEDARRAQGRRAVTPKMPEPKAPCATPKMPDVPKAAVPAVPVEPAKQ
ncbi:MAG: helix-hairpin-helix domain-containing protein [Candidatus Competibacteraceae bacterium]